MDLLDELQVCPSEQKKANFPAFALIFHKKIFLTKEISYSITFMLIGTMRSFDHFARDRSMQSEIKLEIDEMKLLLEVELHFSPAKNSTSN